MSDPEKLKELVRQCLRFPEKRQLPKTLYFRKDGIILSVNMEDIVYVNARNHMLDIHTQQGDVLSIPYVTLKKFLAEADNPDIVQCSRSTVINKKFISNVDIPNQLSRLKGGTEQVEIGMMYKKYFRELLN